MVRVDSQKHIDFSPSSIPTYRGVPVVCFY
jgi:hypothetical protein